jgi:hypothetical protein
MMRMEVADYVESLSKELAKLARDAELPTLAYILDMAALESANIKRENAGATTATKDIAHAA